MLSRSQNAAAASGEYAERLPGRYHPGPRQLLLLIKDSGEMGGMKLRTGP
jgi:hypothetical protein